MPTFAALRARPPDEVPALPSQPCAHALPMRSHPYLRSPARTPSRYSRNNTDTDQKHPYLRSPARTPCRYSRHNTDTDQAQRDVSPRGTPHMHPCSERKRPSRSSSPPGSIPADNSLQTLQSPPTQSPDSTADKGKNNRRRRRNNSYTWDQTISLSPNFCVNQSH